MSADLSPTLFQGALTRVAGLAPVPPLLRSLGADPAAVFAAADVDIALVSDPDNRVTLESLGRLVSRCVQATGCQHFGLLTGQKQGPGTLGLAGLAARHAPDVATALDRLRRLVDFHNSGAIVALEVEKQTAVLVYALHDSHSEGFDQIEEAALAAMFNVMVALCGQAWRPIEVRCSRHRPQNTKPYRDFFQAPIRFDAIQNALVFHAKWLDHRLPPVDAALQRLVQRQVAALEASRVTAFPDQVLAVLRTAVLAGDGTAERVAAHLSMHSRTLARRLAVHGTSFKFLSDQVRLEIARRLLLHTALEIREIAASLDYADASAFTRAFRRWTGTTPAVWRTANAPRTAIQESQGLGGTAGDMRAN